MVLVACVELDEVRVAQGLVDFDLSLDLLGDAFGLQGFLGHEFERRNKPRILMPVLDFVSHLII